MYSIFTCANIAHISLNFLNKFEHILQQEQLSPLYYHSLTVSSELPEWSSKWWKSSVFFFIISQLFNIFYWLFCSVVFHLSKRFIKRNTRFHCHGYQPWCSLSLFLSLTTRASCFFCLSSSRSRTFPSVRGYVIEGREKKGFVSFSFEKECFFFGRESVWEKDECVRLVRCCCFLVASVLSLLFRYTWSHSHPSFSLSWDCQTHLNRWLFGIDTMTQPSLMKTRTISNFNKIFLITIILFYYIYNCVLIRWPFLLNCLNDLPNDEKALYSFVSLASCLTFFADYFVVLFFIFLSDSLEEIRVSLFQLVLKLSDSFEPMIIWNRYYDST